MGGGSDAIQRNAGLQPLERRGFEEDASEEGENGRLAEKSGPGSGEKSERGVRVGMGLQRGENAVEPMLEKKLERRSGLGRQGKESGKTLRRRKGVERLVRLWGGEERRNRMSSEDGEEF